MSWYKKTLESDNQSDILSGMNKELIIMRGAPSSGKSYIAKELAGEHGEVFSADDYHINPDSGEYNWKPKNVKKAHQWNHNRVKNAINQGLSPIIIDNTHTRKWELLALKPIVELAQQNRYKTRIEEPNSNWYYWDTAFNANALYARNKQTHNVPYDTVKKMVNNYEQNVTVEDILEDDK